MNICQTTILLNNGKYCKGKSKRFKRKFQGFSGLFCFSMSNSSVQFEDSTLTSENTAVSVQYNGYLNLNGGSITRKSGTPTVKLKGPSIFLVYNNGSVNDITCDGAFAYIDGQANSTTITNSDNATCK